MKSDSSFQEFPFVWEALSGKPGLNVVMEQLNYDNHSLWSAYGRKQASYHGLAAARHKDRAGSYVAVSDGSDHFRDVINEWPIADAVTWVTYVTRQNPPIPITQANMENYDLVDLSKLLPHHFPFAQNIEMFVTVTTVPSSPVAVHLGIAFTVERALDRSGGLSIPMHAFAARVLMRQNPQKRYLLFTPADSMLRLVQRALPDSVSVAFDSMLPRPTGEPPFLMGAPGTKAYAKEAEWLANRRLDKIERMRYERGIPAHSGDHGLLVQQIADADMNEVLDIEKIEFVEANREKLQTEWPIMVRNWIKNTAAGEFWGDKAEEWKERLSDAIDDYEEGTGDTESPFLKEWTVRTVSYSPIIKETYELEIQREETEKQQRLLDRWSSKEYDAARVVWIRKTNEFILDPHHDPIFINADTPEHQWLRRSIWKPRGTTHYALVDYPALANYQPCKICDKVTASVRCNRCNAVLCDNCK